MNKKLEELTTLELKAIGYENIVKLEEIQQIQQIIRQELLRRANTPPPVEPIQKEESKENTK